MSGNKDSSFICNFICYPSFLEAITIQKFKTAAIAKALRIKDSRIKVLPKKNSFRIELNDSFVEFPMIYWSLEETSRAYKHGSINLDWCIKQYQNIDFIRHGLAFMLITEPLEVTDNGPRIKPASFGGKPEEILYICKLMLITIGIQFKFGNPKRRIS